LARKQKRVREGGRLLHLDCFSGIAGNMFLGALLDAGLSRKALEAELSGLGVEYKLVVKNVMRGAIAARYVDVKLPRKSGAKRSHGHGRHFAEIAKLLGKAKLEAGIRARALAIFEALARAEAKIHGLPIEKVHFHEVGAVDAIVDITGAAAGLALLGVTRVSASPIGIGSNGTVETDHGRLPVPPPAVLELLRGVPVTPAHVEWETVTPTGAALVATLVEEFGPLPAMTVEAIGHGAGNDRPGPLPNVLRAILGHGPGAQADRVVLLETNLDDLVPEHFDHLMERLFAAGALDVSLQHLQMKKNRPGFLVRVLAKPSDRVPLASLLFAESTAIGVRVTESDRIVLRREQARVTTPFGRVRVKRIWGPDGRLRVSAEYDDCAAAARRSGAPLRDVVRAAEEAGCELD
jgi:uncharacterized protein (TIGR00299 family) protein